MNRWTKYAAAFLCLGGPLLPRVQGDDGQWGQFYRRQEQESFRQSLRDLDHYYRYDPNPRSSPAAVEPLRRQLMNWAASVDEARRQRAEARRIEALALAAYLRESQRQAEEQARQATLARWNALKQQAVDGDLETSYRVARLIRWGQGRLPAGQPTGEDAARPWYQFAAEKGHGDAAYELALMVEKTAPEQALLYYTHAASAGKREAVLPAADLAATGVPGRLPPNPLEAIRLYEIGAGANDAAALTTGAYFLLNQSNPTAERVAQAIAWLERAADREAAAAGKLGFLRLFDQPGRPRDYPRAVALAREALRIQPGQPDALITLGAAKIDGLGGETVDGPGAVALLERAASAGSWRACHVLATAYHSGLGGLARSDADAVRWRIAGARLGHVDSMLELALRYRTGQGVAASGAESARWLMAAAAAGAVAAMVELAGRMAARDPDVSLTMPYLRTLAGRAANNGDAEAQGLYAGVLMDGFGGEKSPREALTWYRRAAENGSLPAQYLLARHLLEGDQVEADPAGAYSWMRRAAEGGIGDACAFMAWHHATGTACAQDLAGARDWARRGAELGSVMARRSYGSYLGDGVGGPQDGPEAIRQLTLATEGNDDRARLQLAQYFEDGLPGVPANRAAARPLYEAAARSSEPDVAARAKQRLGALDAPKPVSLQDLLLRGPVAPTNGASTSIYERLRIR